MNLILFKGNEVSKDGKSIQLQPKDPRTKHIFGHLRKKDGDSVTIGIVSGGRGKAIIRTSEDGSSRLEFEDENILKYDSTAIDDNKLVLVLSLPFPKRLKALWPQITSMGVTHILIVRGKLSEPTYCGSSVITPEVYRPLVEEGMSQGCHTRQVTVGIEVDEILSKETLQSLGLFRTQDEWTKDGTAPIFLDCGTDVEPMACRQAIFERLQKAPSEIRKRIILAIGSERGWTEDESKLFQEAGFEPASLGKSILRVDTAVIAGLGIASATLDEFRCERHKIRDRKRKQDMGDETQL